MEQLSEKTKALDKLVDNFINDIKLLNECYPDDDEKQASVVLVSSFQNPNNEKRSFNKDMIIGSDGRVVLSLLALFSKSKRATDLIRQAMNIQTLHEISDMIEGKQ